MLQTLGSPWSFLFRRNTRHYQSHIAIKPHTCSSSPNRKHPALSYWGRCVLWSSVSMNIAAASGPHLCTKRNNNYKTTFNHFDVTFALWSSEVYSPWPLYLSAILTDSFEHHLYRCFSRRPISTLCTFIIIKCCILLDRQYLLFGCFICPIRIFILCT